MATIADPKRSFDHDELVARAQQVALWCGEDLLLAGDDAARALAEGTARRRALDAGLLEIAEGFEVPSSTWRFRFSLMLGLERVLAQETPCLANGLSLRAHQIDALAGMLAALTSEEEREEAADEDDAASDEAEAEAENDEADDEEAEEDADETEASAADPADEAPTPIDDPGAARRYRFKHPTASGKTVAAAGFVEACRTVGVLILTHRRLLVDQFMRDLKEQGYGPRLIGAIEKNKRMPRVPPVTVETYAWFIKHADEINPDAYGVVICDEAHTALGERTAATIRRFRRPTYIGMTATDQLLQKHVGDVFPAEVADFPLADAVRRGVVAPLRCVRVKPGASLRNVPVVGGDFDQRLLAEALDHEALNMAAAMFYADRFGHRAGIVYAAGVDHSERVAAAMRAVGLRAKSVSGRTPPRVLAATLAAYERGETNVLVNAQLLAEGWNAPRATICMHLAPTASRRVYQQRLGRVMRLHRRKEAGVIVDFVDPVSPHSDRTITVHSLLDVDTYRPGALVTPKPARRRQRWRRQARPVVRDGDWMIPVAEDPARRRAVILEQWKIVAADRLPADEQAYWAETSARRVARSDLPRLVDTLAKVTDLTRISFFATCAAENKHRSLRRIALTELTRAHPDVNTIDRMVRLIEAAPTWQNDRAPGARVLLLAIAAELLPGSQSQHFSWTWKLARASRETQYRHATMVSTNARDLLKALAGSRGDEHQLRARLLVKAVQGSELSTAGAMLAAALTHDAIAGRAIELARAELGEDVEALAAALAANIPEQRLEEPVAEKPRRRRKKAVGGARPAEPEMDDPTLPVEDEVGEVAQVEADGAPSPARKRRRRRRKRRGDSEQPAVVEPAAERPAPEPAVEVEPAKPRRRRSKAAIASEVAAAAEPTPEVALESVEPAPRPRRRRAVAKAPQGDGPAPVENAS